LGYTGAACNALHFSSMTESIRQRLTQTGPLVGTILTLPSPAVAELLVDIGFDWLFIDAEHAPFSTGDVQAALQAAGGCPCLVRIPSSDEVFVKQVLDAGADGIIAPLVNTAEAAERIVRCSKYPPAGTRSVGIARAHGYGRRFREHVARANEDLAVVIQIEHFEAADNIEAILEVPGIDAVFLGPYDLSGSIGRPGEIDDPGVQACITMVRDACRRKAMPLGIFGANADAVSPYIVQGYSLVAVGTDMLFLASAAEAALTGLGRGS
jgi:2-dehydro-3-deoxyglucarate aldolase